MGIFDRLKQKGTLSGTIELRGLPTQWYSVAVCFFRVDNETSPPPFDGKPPVTAYTEDVSVKEEHEPEGKPLEFKVRRRAGFYYVDVGLITYFERDGSMFAQVEHFIPMKRPCHVQATQDAHITLVVEWPDIPFDELHHSGTVHPQQ